MSYLLLDYETRSRIDLAAAGQHPYAKDPSTEILCAGYKIIGEKTNKLLSYPAIYTDDASQTADFYYALKHCSHVVAHNAPFEQAIFNHTMLKTTPMGEKLTRLPPEKFICTAASAAIMGLPRSLEKAAKALELPFKKDTEGRRLMLKMCKPRKNITKRTDVAEWVEWVLDDEHLIRLYEYCKVDLDVEEALFNTLMPYQAWTAKERYTWVLDQNINQRGFAVDFDFIVAARDLLMSNEKVLNAELLEKTLYTVKTAKSTASLKKFIAMQGHTLPNVQKKTVAKLLHELRTEGHERDKELIEVLSIREQLGLSSTSKYEAFYQRAGRDDCRVRDNLIYHGAATGRWAGTGVQPQNFPRGTVKVKENFFADFKHIATVNETYVNPDKYIREVITELDEEGDEVTETLNDTPISHADYARIFYPALTPTLSSMLRGCIIAAEGKHLNVGDFSSIEARVLLWCAGDTEGLAEYATGIDAYCSMASTVYKRKYEDILNEYEINGHSDERQVGKKVILACFEKGTQVLTDKGFICITQVTPLHKLWDGVEWHNSEGVVCKGQRETINFYGVRVTPEHLILTPSGWAQASQVLSEGTKCLKSVVCLTNLQLGRMLSARGAALLRLEYLARAALGVCITSTLSILSKVKALGVIPALKKLRVSLINSTLSTRPSYLTTSIGGVYLTVLALFFLDVIIKVIKAITTTAGAVSKYMPLGLKTVQSFLGILSRSIIGKCPSTSLTALTLIKGTYLKTYALSRSFKTSLIDEALKVFRPKSKDLEKLSPVYDIAYAGPRNRFTIMTTHGPVLAHNCGYGMGLTKFTTTLEDDGIFLEAKIIKDAHAAFKLKYPKVPRLWRQVEAAAIAAVQHKGKGFKAGKCTYVMKRDFLSCILPSGRRLWYYKPEVTYELTPWGEKRAKLYYHGTNSQTKQYGRTSTYGGKLVENIVQAISRDCMSNSMINLEREGHLIVLTVHDEVITESTKPLDEFKKLMAKPPEWGLDIPLKVGAWQSSRYRK